MADDKKEPMTSKELNDRIAELAGEGTTAYQVRKILGLLADVIEENAKEGRGTKLSGIGVLNVKEAPARIAHNPRTGEAMEVPAHGNVKFTAVKRLKDAAR